MNLYKSVNKNLKEWDELYIDEYKKFRNIDAVWDYLEASKDENDLKNRIMDINPQKFGAFTYSIEGDHAVVSNDYSGYGDIEKVDIYFNESEKLKESEDNVVRVKDCPDDVDLIMAIEGDTVKVEDAADWERVKNLAKDFSRSQGFYGRLLRNMNEFEESYGGVEDLPFPIFM